MRILILGPGTPYSQHRFKKAARTQNHQLTCANMNELSFSMAKNGKTQVTISKNTPIESEFDVIVLRNFYPEHISEGLFLAEFAVSNNIKIFDKSLTEHHFIYNKWYNNWKLATANLPVVPSIQFFNQQDLEENINKLNFPVILKGIHGSRGNHVYKIETQQQLKQKISNGTIGNFILQNFIETDHEYRVVVVGGKVIGAAETKTRANDFRHIISDQKAEITSELAQICEKAAQTLGFDFAAIDLGIKNNQPVIFEVNRCPGFEGFEKATGIDVASAFIQHITQS